MGLFTLGGCGSRKRGTSQGTHSRFAGPPGSRGRLGERYLGASGVAGAAGAAGAAAGGSGGFTAAPMAVARRS